METPDDQLPVAIEQHQLVQVDQNPDVAVMQIIATAAANPDTDIEKMKSLIEMKKDMDAHDAEKEYWKALTKLQFDLPIIQKQGEGHNSNYGKFEDIMLQIKPMMKKHGFAITWKHKMQEQGVVKTVGRLSHKSGHVETDEFESPPDTSGSKNAIQAVGSSRSYGKRYTASSLLGLAFTDEDDDGAAASGSYPGKTASVEERTATGKAASVSMVSQMKKQCLKYSVLESNIARHFNVKDLAQLPSSRVNEALDLISAQQ